MDTKNKNRDIVKSQTPESNTPKPTKTRASLLEATALGIASGLPFELIEPITLDENEDSGLTIDFKRGNSKKPFDLSTNFQISTINDILEYGDVGWSLSQGYIKCDKEPIE